MTQSPDTSDPVPEPEPAVPSLDEPDPGVFHHDPVRPVPQEPVFNPGEPHT